MTTARSTYGRRIAWVILALVVLGELGWSGFRTYVALNAAESEATMVERLTGLDLPGGASVAEATQGLEGIMVTLHGAGDEEVVVDLFPNDGTHPAFATTASYAVTYRSTEMTATSESVAALVDGLVEAIRYIEGHDLAQRSALLQASPATWRTMLELELVATVGGLALAVLLLGAPKQRSTMLPRPRGRLEVPLVVMASLAAVAVRLPLLLADLDPDEVVSLTPLEPLAALVDPESMYNPPLYRLLLGLWGSASTHLAWLRTSNLLLAPIMVVAITYAVRRVYGIRAGLAAGLVVGLHPQLTMVTMLLRPYALLAPLTALTIWGTVLLLRGDGRRRWWALLVVGTVAMVWTHWLGLVIAVAPWAVVLVGALTRRVGRGASMGATAATLLGVAPLAPLLAEGLVAKQAGVATAYDYASVGAFAMDAGSALSGLHGIVGLVMVAVVVAGLVRFVPRKGERHRLARVVLPLTVVVLTGALLAMASLVPIRLRYVIPLAMLLFAGLGILLAQPRGTVGALLVGMTALGCVSLAAAGVPSATLTTGPSLHRASAAVACIEANDPTPSRILVVPAFELGPTLFAATGELVSALDEHAIVPGCGATAQCVTVGGVDWVGADLGDETSRAIITGAMPVWVVSHHEAHLVDPEAVEGCQPVCEEGTTQVLRCGAGPAP